MRQQSTPLSLTPLLAVSPGSAWFAALVMIAVIGSGCAATSRVDDSITTAALAQDKRAVFVLRVGAASPTCRHVAILLGTVEGAGFRRERQLQVMEVHSVVEPAVVEAEIAPGTYHVIGYSCHDGTKAKAVAQKADREIFQQTYATSYASFTVKAGEIVNLGYLHFHGSRVGTNAFGRPIRTDVTVSDWPLAELDRFKLKRPGLYGQMTTRLMAVNPTGPQPPTSADCARYEALKREGKVAAMPASCGT